MRIKQAWRGKGPGINECVYIDCGDGGMLLAEFPSISDAEEAVDAINKTAQIIAALDK